MVLPDVVEQGFRGSVGGVHAEAHLQVPFKVAGPAFSRIVLEVPHQPKEGHLRPHRMATWVFDGIAAAHHDRLPVITGGGECAFRMKTLGGQQKA